MSQRIIVECPSCGVRSGLDNTSLCPIAERDEARKLAEECWFMARMFRESLACDMGPHEPELLKVPMLPWKRME